jgi:glucans biosynthesis protein
MRLESGQTVWRPLDNGAKLRHQTFPAPNIKGFGLLQRERNFEAYQDMFHACQNAPSVWVETPASGPWGNGTLHLVELSTQYEGLDNIVAFWDPATKPAPMQPLRFAYTLYWTRETDISLSSNVVTATRVGLEPQNQKEQWRQMMIDFDLPRLKGDDSPPKALTTCSDNGAITNLQVLRNPVDNKWRVSLDLAPRKPDSGEPVDLTCTLKRSDGALSETWSYRWTPP